MGSRFYSKRLRVINQLKRKTRSRPKTFRTDDAANNWAKKKGIKDYTLKNLKIEGLTVKKIVVIPK